MGAYDLSVIVVSYNCRRWLRPALTSVYDRAGTIALEVIVVDNGSDGAGDLVRREFPAARVVTIANHGFAHANNRGLEVARGRHVLYLNPDTKLLSSTLERLIAVMDARPSIGIASVRQVTEEGILSPSMKRFPSPLRALAEALGAERLPARLRCLGERDLRMERYERETRCEWLAGCFMLARREAIDASGPMDERFFLFSEETDLCRRVHRRGWEIVHLPYMTILHHEGKAGIDPTLEAQMTYARMQYADKHFSTLRRHAYAGALALRHLLRAAAFGQRGGGDPRGVAARRSLAVLAGREGSPFATHRHP
jgi:GT2 family glycosyltransferase